MKRITNFKNVSQLLFGYIPENTRVSGFNDIIIKLFFYFLLIFRLATFPGIQPNITFEDAIAKGFNEVFSIRSIYRLLCQQILLCKVCTGENERDAIGQFVMFQNSTEALSKNLIVASSFSFF